MRFLAGEKRRLVTWKESTGTLSEAARSVGDFRGRSGYDFCLPAPFALENLFPTIRADAASYFADVPLVWHQGTGGGPTTHLCGGQVCAVNFLFHLSSNPDALLRLFAPIMPDIVHPLEMDPGRFVSFEWIGKRNYL